MASVAEGAEASDWPVWNYVAEQFDRRADAAFDDAADVLRSMPTLPPPRLHTRPYGPVWRVGTDTDEPAPDGRVGLTVSGLARLVTEKVPDVLRGI